MSKEGYYTSESNEKEPKGTIHDIKISTFTEDPSDPQSAYYTRILNESIGNLVEWAKPNIPDTLKMVLQCMTATLNVSPGELVVLLSV